MSCAQPARVLGQYAGLGGARLAVHLDDAVATRGVHAGVLPRQANQALTWSTPQLARPTVRSGDANDDRLDPLFRRRGQKALEPVPQAQISLRP